jgi:hypothetical protein
VTGARLLTRMNTRRVVVPDLGDAVIEVVSDLTEMLLALVDETLENELPSVLADGFGLEALDRIWVVLKPTQERTAPRLFAPEWRAEYLRLSVVELDAADLATMGEAIRALGAGLLTADPQITGALVDFSDAAPPAAVAGTTPADIIASFARLHGLLDLAWTDDAERLDEQLNKAVAADELVLDSPTAAAYLRLASRFGAMWGPHPDLERSDER